MIKHVARKWFVDEPTTDASMSREKLALRGLGLPKEEAGPLNVTLYETPERQSKTHHPLAEVTAIESATETPSNKKTDPRTTKHHQSMKHKARTPSQEINCSRRETQG